MGRGKTEKKQGKKGWKVASKDGKFLVKLIKDSKVSPGCTPGLLKEMHPRFAKYKNDSFAAGLRRLKTKYGLNVRGDTDGEGEDEDEDANTLATNEDDDDDDDDEEEEDTKPAAVLTVASATRSSQRSSQMVPSVVKPTPFRIQPSFNNTAGTVAQAGTWNPIYIKTIFTDGQMKLHQVVMVLLPGGVGHTKTEDIELSLHEIPIMHETYLKINIQWPDWIISNEFLAVMRQTLAKEVAPKLNALGAGPEFEALKSKFQENTVLLQHAIKATMAQMRVKPESPMLHACAMIKLDMSVKPITYNDWHFVGDIKGVRMVFVDLKAQEETSYEKSKYKNVELGTLPPQNGAANGGGAGLVPMQE